MEELFDAKGNPPLDPSLLPIFQRYKQENEHWIPDFDLWSYLNLRADIDLAAAFSKLFWPDFVEIDGCVLLALHYERDNFEHWKEHFDGNRSATEAMINHVHIHDLFVNSASRVEYPAELKQYLGKVLLICWRHALEDAFPSRHFVFSIAGPSEPSISFYQAG